MKEKDFLWVRQCILSCKLPFQFQSCEVLVKLYRRNYLYEPGTMAEYFTLMDLLKERWVPVEVDGL